MNKKRAGVVEQLKSLVKLPGALYKAEQAKTRARNTANWGVIGKAKAELERRRKEREASR